MKNIVTLFFIVLISILAASCPLFPCKTVTIPDNTITIHGTVTITRNGIPWNTANFPARSIRRYTGNENAARDVPPPHPWIRAYTRSETEDRIIHIGTAYTDTGINHLIPADNADGTYNWSMKIPPDKLPALIHFEVSGDIMEDVSFFGVSNSSVKMTEAIQVNNKNEIIDLGVIDFKILRLSGNLPVTINGEPLDYDTSWVTIYASHLRTSILPNGDWSLFVFPPNYPCQLSFRIEAVKGVLVENINSNHNYAKYSYFKEELNPDDVIALYDTDREVILPSVDFKAFTISGTIKFIASGGSLSWYDINFYEKAVPNYTSWDFQIASIVDWSPQPERNGIIQWEIVVPAFSFPHSLPFWIRATVGNRNGSNTASSSVLITCEADLNSIDLGTYNVR